MTGELRRGGQITIDYDTSRLPDWRRSQAGDTASRLFASLRFYPGGQEVRTHLIQRAEGRATRLLDTRKLLPQPLTIPPDASHLEMWFESNDTDGYSAWDSRFGQNYWFDIKPTMPRQAVSYRAGAGTRLDMVNVFSEKVIKVNAFPRPGSSHV